MLELHEKMWFDHLLEGKGFSNHIKLNPGTALPGKHPYRVAPQ